MTLVSLSTSLFDGLGFEWDVQTDGRIFDGQDDAFDGAFDWIGYSSSSYALQVGNDLELERYFASFSDLIYDRKVTVSDSDNWIRYFDTITNNAAAAISYTFELRFNFGQGTTVLYNTSSGDGVFDVSDTWFSVSSSDPSNTDTKSGILFGDGSLLPALSQSSDTVDVEYTVTLGAGESLSFLTFGTQDTTVAGVESTLLDLADLDFDALDGLTGQQIEQIVNWDIPSLALTLTGGASADRLIGGDVGDSLFGAGGNDTLVAQRGDDFLEGGGGNDNLFAGEGNDTLFGDAASDLQTVSAETTLANTEALAISLTMPDRDSGPTVDISGFLSRQPVVSEFADVVFAIDTSGSTTDPFIGTQTVGDRNGDGRSDTILDAEIAAFEALLNSIIDDAQLPDAQITVLEFNDDASFVFSGRATQDLDADGTYDVIEAVQALRSGGGTDFESAMQLATQHFSASPEGQRAFYFLSDGGNNQGGPIDDDAAALAALNVQTQAIGVGVNAEEADLDIVDDGLDNDSATIVLDPDLLSDTLLDPGIAAADISAIEVLRNGVVVGTIDPNDLTVTPFGLRYFEYTVTGLNVSADDTIALRVTAADGANTQLSVSQVLEHLALVEGNDFLKGGNGNDSLEGGGGNDTLLGGNGIDIIDGGEGIDEASYQDAGMGLRIDLADMNNSTGAAKGDVLRDIEKLRGSHYDDDIFGTSSADDMNGGIGNDRIFGLAGNDVLTGDQNNDTLFGGNGNDILLGGLGNDVGYGGNNNDFLGGGAGNDTLRGENGNDRMSGGNGNDQLFGGIGSDYMTGNGQNDFLGGGGGNDTLLGEGGIDILNGDTGNDVLTGGWFSDKFVFRGNFGQDTITDFDPNNVNEKIDLQGAAWITDLNDLFTNHMFQVGTDVEIRDLLGNIITVENVTLAAMQDGNDFLI